MAAVSGLPCTNTARVCGQSGKYLLEFGPVRSRRRVRRVDNATSSTRSNSFAGHHLVGQGVTADHFEEPLEHLGVVVRRRGEGGGPATLGSEGSKGSSRPCKNASTSGARRRSKSTVEACHLAGRSPVRRSHSPASRRGSSMCSAMAGAMSTTCISPRVMPRPMDGLVKPQCVAEGHDPCGARRPVDDELPGGVRRGRHRKDVALPLPVGPVGVVGQRTKDPLEGLGVADLAHLLVLGRVVRPPAPPGPE